MGKIMGCRFYSYCQDGGKCPIASTSERRKARIGIVIYEHIYKPECFRNHKKTQKKLLSEK